MDMANSENPSRRGILEAIAGLPFVGAFRWAGATGGLLLAETPELPDPDEPTPRMTEGPFYKRNSPLRASLIEKGATGEKLVIEGKVLSTDGKPIPGALLDFWQCDAKGAYDNAGFELRGHQFADSEGRYRLETLVPGLYTGRTRHIHARVQPPNGKVLTTQLFFPNEPGNKRDRIFRERCLIRYAEDTKPADAKLATFDFVLALT